MLNLTFPFHQKDRHELYKMFRLYLIPSVGHNIVQEIHEHWYFSELPFDRFAAFVKTLSPEKLLDENLLYGNPDSPTLRVLLQIPKELQRDVTFTGYIDTGFLTGKYRLRIRIIRIPRDTEYTRFLARSADTTHTFGGRVGIFWY